MSLFQAQLTTDDSEDAGTFQQQALEISLPGKHFDPNAVPTNGEEFLTFMAYERKNTPAVMSRLPAVKRFKKDTANEIEPAYAASIINDQKCAAQGREFLLQTNSQRCSDEWKVWQMNLFQSTRDQAHKLRSEEEFSQPTQLELPVDPSEWLQFCSTTPPQLKETLSLGQRDLENLLEAICDWLQRGDDAADDGAAIQRDENVGEVATPANDDVAKETELKLKITTPWLGQWLYATLICLNLPLEPFVHSSMREIVRIFVRQRARLGASNDFSQHINTYNIFIHIIAKFFGQLDFAEFV